jgi:uncharacterized coiled-coil DUF342 family protein
MESELKDIKEKLYSDLNKCKVALKLNKEMQNKYDTEIREFKETRDEYNEKFSELIEKGKEEKILRDSYNREFQQLKQKKDDLHEQISEYKAERDSKWILYKEFKNQFRELLEEKNKLKRSSNSARKMIDTILMLDWKFQTTSMDFEEERRLVEKIEELQSKIDKNQKYQDLKMINLELDELIKNLDEFRESANHYHKLMTELYPKTEELQEKMDEIFQTADIHHEKMVQFYDEANAIKAEADKAHEQMVEKIQAVQLLRKGYESKEKELEIVKSRLGKIKYEESLERRQKYIEIEENRAKELLAKHNANEQLTFDEIGFLMAKGLITMEELGNETGNKATTANPDNKFKLTNLDGLGVRDEKVLIENGIKSIKDLCDYDLDKLIDIIPYKSTIKLKNWLNDAKSITNQS